MPRFYFDISDGDEIALDEDGVDCADLEKARHEAIKSLPEIACDLIDAGDTRMLSIRVRDQTDFYVFEAHLSLVSGWLEHPTRDLPGQTFRT